MKEEQKKLITEIMNDDAKDGLYISPTKSNADMNIGVPKKTTAVEWLVEQIKSDQNQKALSATEWMEVIERAKQMEKEQIINAYKFGLQDEYVIGSEQYYNETYNK